MLGATDSCVIVSVSEAIERVGILFGIPCLLVATLVTLARNDPPPTPSAREGVESHKNKNGRIGGATLVALGVRFLFECG